MTPRSFAFATAIVVALFECAGTTRAAGRTEPVGVTQDGIGVLGDGAGAVTIGGGVFNAFRRGEQGGSSGALRMEYRVGEQWYGIGPLVGALVNSEGGAFAYIALYTDLRLAERWVLTPAAGLGAYAAGDGKDMGGIAQFHLALDLAYRLAADVWLGLKVAHISNAGAHKANPGANSVLLTLTLPLGASGTFSP